MTATTNDNPSQKTDVSSSVLVFHDAKGDGLILKVWKVLPPSLSFSAPLCSDISVHMQTHIQVKVPCIGGC